jgi:hypothetical protein
VVRSVVRSGMQVLFLAEINLAQHRSLALLHKVGSGTGEQQQNSLVVQVDARGGRFCLAPKLRGSTRTVVSMLN